METAVTTQYEEELPVTHVVVRQFDLHVGRCNGCGRRVQGRHPLQTSDAIGAAAAQLGAQAIALVVVLNKQLGLSFGKIATLLQQLYGLTVTRSALVHAVHRTARQALAVRDRHQAGVVSAHGLADARGHLIARLAARLDRPSGVPDVERSATHLDREFTAIWSFLFDPTIDATNWRAEHAIRPIVVTRKVCGGNRSWAGADSQQILASVVRTASQRDLNPHVVLASMLHLRTRGVIAELN